VPGEAGVWVFLFGDLLIFAAAFAAFLYERTDDPVLFDRSQQALDQTYGIVNTFVLLASSLLVVVAMRAVRAGRPALAGRLVLGALGCGALFVALKGLDYVDRIQSGAAPAANPFDMYYFVMTGMHLFHVVLGLAVLVAVHRLVRRPGIPTTSQAAFVEGGACFWHMVDLLWLLIFPLLYLVHG